MLTLLLSCASALLWATSTVTGSRVSRATGSSRALAWNMGVGTVLLLPWLILVGGRPPEGLQWAWMVVAGLSTVLAFLCLYEAVHFGPVGLVGAISSTEGAFASLAAVATGQPVTPLEFVAVPVLTVGLLMVMLPAELTHLHATNWPKALTLATLSAVLFGLSVFAAARIAESSDVLWALLPGRTLGAAVFFLPLAVAGRVGVPRRLMPWVVATAACDLAGFAVFGFASRGSVVVAAIVSSQFGVLAAMYTAARMHEHLSRRQVVGLTMVGLGIALVAAASAG